MKNWKLFLLSIALCLSGYALFAQIAADSSKVGYGPVGILGNLPPWALVVVCILYELIVRLVPTTKNMSVISNVSGLIDKIVPNRKKTPTPGGVGPSATTFQQKF
jgi:hypothetical protein